MSHRFRIAAATAPMVSVAALPPGPARPSSATRTTTARAFEATMTSARIRLLRPARHGEPARPGGHLFKPLRQIIESVNDTLKGQLDLEHHGGRTPSGVTVRVLQRILALTAAIWHNDTTGAAHPALAHRPRPLTLELVI